MSQIVIELEGSKRAALRNELGALLKMPRFSRVLKAVLLALLLCCFAGSAVAQSSSTPAGTSLTLSLDTPPVCLNLSFL
jgi:hypothetical protein